MQVLFHFYWSFCSEYLISSWFSFSRPYVSRLLSISYSLSIFCHIIGFLFLVFFLFLETFILEYLVNNVVLVSGVQWSDSVIQISILFQTLFLSSSLQSIEQSSLCTYDNFLLVICFKDSSVYMSIPIFHSIPLPHPYSMGTRSLFSESVSVL